MATIKVEFQEKANGHIYTMLFGDSYKSWKEQYREYMQGVRDSVRPLFFFKSSAKWVGWGGLKWCSETNFQEILNREGCQRDEPDNPKPRQYKDFQFQEFKYYE